MNQLQISLFAPLQIRLNNEIISDFRLQKAPALLAYLAAEPETAQRRETLMALLWPDMPDSSARSNLRQVLFQLRKAIPDFVVDDTSTSTERSTNIPLLITNRHTIQLNPDAPVSIDTAQFDAHLQQVQAHEHYNLLSCHPCQENLSAVTDLYTGPFLADFYLEDSNEFEAWTATIRQSYVRKMLDALDTLTKINMHQQAYASAQQYAERQLELDNLHEPAYQQLLEILARNGQRNAALAVYEKCRRLFHEELGMAPATRTTELYEQILAGDLQFDSVQAQGVRGYDLQEEIGAGAYGVIHRALQPVVGREVAVKIIHRQYASDPAFIRRFETEAQTIARLEHPHIVPLYDFWRDPNGAYLVMRLLRGGNLLTALSQGYWPVERARTLLDQICAALAAAHQQGIVHRDIKPANILFDESGNAYLSDFGIAKDLHNNQGLTTDGSMLGTPDYISPEQIQEAPVSPQSDIYSLGAVLYEMLTGEKPFPDVPLMTLYQNHLTVPIPLVGDTRPDLSPQIDAVIQKATAKKPEDRFVDALTFAEAFKQAVDGRLDMPAVIAQMPTAIEIINPYKGLRAFQEADVQDFYGRDNLTSQLIEHLHQSSFLAVVGPSGSGKSSVVKAGMIPALRQGAIPGSEKWFVAEMVPGTHPLEELELALWPIAVDPPPSLVEPMQRDPRGMLRTIRRILPKEDDAQLLLVIDQFEELWSLTSAERRQHFLDSLLAAINSPRCPLHVVITLRADFYDRPLQYQPIAELFKHNTEVVLPLTYDELTWAIQEPARRMGVTYDETVLSAIVAEVRDQPGALPLLQYALTELFAARSGNQITRQTFDELGGVLGALPRRADEIFDSLSLADKAAARQFFLRLITLGEGIEDTRRRVLLSELEALNLIDEQRADTQSPIRAIIDQYGAARLLTLDHDPLTRQPTVEVAHEALLREWQRLRSWLDESRDDLRLQRLLATAVAEWQSAAQDPGYLLSGTRLDQFELWAEDTTVALTADEQAYLAASIAARQQRQAEEAARQQRELETAQQLAATERQRAEEQVAAAQNLRRRAAYLGVALVVAALLAIAAVWASVQANNNAQTAVANANIAATQEAAAVAARNNAEEQTRLSTSRELALAALSNLNEDPELSILLALEALNTSQTTEAEEALHRAVQESQTRLLLYPNEKEPTLEVLFSPDGSQLLTGVATGEAILWDVDTGEKLVTFDGHKEDWVQASDISYVISPDYSPDGKRVVTGGEDGTVRIWDPENGQELMAIEAHQDRVDGVAFSPDGAKILTASWDNTAKIWDSVTGELLLAVEEIHPPAWDISQTGAWGADYSPDGRRFATAGTDGLGKVWDAETGAELLVLVGHEEPLWDVAFSPDGTRIATSSFGGEARIWDAKTGEEIHNLVGHTSSLRELDFSHDGSLLGTASADGTAKIWDVATGEELTTLAGHKDRVMGIDFSPDGTEIATSSRDRTARIWEVGSGRETFALGIDINGVLDVSYSPDGQRLATIDWDGLTQIWNASTGEELFSLEGHEDWSGTIEYSSDGNLLATASDDGTAIVRDAQTGELLYRLDGHAGEWVNDLAFSADSTLLATAGNDHYAVIWDLTSGTEQQRFDHGDEIRGVSLSPDNRFLAAGGHDTGVTGETGDGAIIVWDIASEERVHELLGHESLVLETYFSPDGSQLLTSAADSTARLWDMSTGEELFVLEGHTGPIWRADFSPDGSIVATGASDGRLMLWDVATGTTLMTLAQYEGSVGGIDFSPDGTRLMVATDRVLEYVLPLDELIELAHTRVTRTLTDEECRQYLHVEACPQ